MKKLLLLIFGLIFLAACMTDIEQSVKNIPAVNAFLEDHPDAEVSIIFLDKAAVAERSEQLEELCNGPVSNNREFYYVNVKEDAQEIQLLMDDKTGQLLCLKRIGKEDDDPIKISPKEDCDVLKDDEKARCYDAREQKQRDQWKQEQKACEKSGNYWNTCPSDCKPNQELACATVCGTPRCESLKEMSCWELDEKRCSLRDDCNPEYKVKPIDSEQCQINENGVKTCTVPVGEVFVGCSTDTEERKEEACKVLSEKACRVRADCEPEYGASRCESDGPCTTDIVYKGCRERTSMCTANYDPVCGSNGQTYANACYAAREGIKVVQKGACVSIDPVERPFINSEDNAREQALLAFNKQWSQVSDGCGSFNEDSGMMEPEEIVDVEKEDDGYKMTLLTYCGMYPSMPAEPDNEHEYFVQWDGDVLWEDKKIYGIESTTSASESGTSPAN
ncbi:MAG: Kazal-type serine protease inhibitor family protein [Nanoarchaeota archaeon]|nr:Kazal-type serine protease inhibitor family protein [Nanoarchaeota archaeon]